jgi:hypothetical protein
MNAATSYKLSAMPRLLRLATTLTAVGFAVGGLGHAVNFVLTASGMIISPPGYPPWRHAVMACVDATIVAVALRRSTALVFVLALFLAEQIATNGRFALAEWLRSGVLHGPVIVMLILEAVAVSAAAVNRCQSRWTGDPSD